MSEALVIFIDTKMDHQKTRQCIRFWGNDKMDLLDAKNNLHVNAYELEKEFLQKRFAKKFFQYFC